jgi:putative protease
MNKHTQLPELLAPAGDWEAMRSACANGADAVYFGLSAFNARHRAANFTPEELPQVMDFLHSRNVRGFVTLNILVFTSELPDVAKYLKLIAQAGVDAIIVQDLGLAFLASRMIPELHVHASTQMTLTEPRGVEFAREKLHIRRAVLARELSIDDIRKVAAGTTVPLEVFVHGALCVAYSGQCLTSEALGGRSANRGQCAQACRLPYEMIVDGEKRDLGDRAYLLSPQDLAAHDLVGDLTDAGVISFKIEGRLKGPAYVAATTQTYRQAIDAVGQQQTFHASKDQLRDLQQTFSRGFTPGFLQGADHQKLVAGRFPKSRGICVGKVIGTAKLGVRVELNERDPDILIPGDGVVFDSGHPEEKEPGGRIWQVRPVTNTASKTVLEIFFADGSIDFDKLPTGALVWKTDDPTMRKRLEQTYVGDPIARREPLHMTVSGRLGGALRLRVRDTAGREVSADWPGPLETARKHPATPDTVREQLGRLGETPFTLAELTWQLPDDVMLPKSVLNDLRRNAITDLLAKRKEATPIAVAEPEALQQLRAEVQQRVKNTPPLDARSRLTVLVRTMEQLDAVLPYHPAYVYCDFEDARRYRDAVVKANAAGVPIGLATFRILKPGEEGFLKQVHAAEPDAVLIRHLGAMRYFQDHAPHITRIGDFSLNVANELTADLLLQEGFSCLVPSYDLNWEQFAALMKNSHPGWYEAVIHQHMPMFHMEHCVFAAFLSKGKDYRDCGRPCDTHKVDLKDRVGAEFPVIPDAGCRNTVYNSVPQSAAEYLRRMQDLGLRRFRIDMLRESPQEAIQLIEKYRRALDGIDDGKQMWKELKALNQLGVTRGTLNLL